MIVDSTAPVTLVGGGPCDTATLQEALTLAPVLVAADGGADHCLAAGLTPRAVIGDLDSISEAARAAFADRLMPVREQETTDFDKALRAIHAPLVIGVGFAGGRIDHMLAVLHSLMVHPGRRCIVLGPDDLVFHCPAELSLDLPPGLALSLFPLAELRVTSGGLVWPTDRLVLAPGRRIGTSNAVAGPVRLAPTGPGLLVMLPRTALARAAAALAGAGGDGPGSAGS
jgi:thiamine pyrophosphokinase